MEPTREQIIHDLAMSCVSGIIQNMVIRHELAFLGSHIYQIFSKSTIVHLSFSSAFCWP